MSRNTLGASGNFAVLEQDHARQVPAKVPVAYNPITIHQTGAWGATCGTESPVTIKAGGETFDRTQLAWPHLKEEKWISESAERHVAAPSYAPNKRHSDAYYKQMSGLGTPSAMVPSATGGPTHMQKGLGNVEHMQVPHSSHFPSL
eukprot:CAMPEP_0197860306 /NCGR_PEP_ID=MMETSP1438-20131217/35574_1 /TAXON_ID=1461541 /ORGANISM="Pterosperma sp., Strain CCMP1384" /LENGTH=145 /DNA_ID=CAMNT_0043477117 /DNA_START=92 /DNA_END=529 /DNA_ORIENTATION=-